MPGERRAPRRRASFGLLCLAAPALAVAAIAAFNEGGRASAEAVLPLHPVAGAFVPDETTLAECSDAACFEQAFGNIAFRQGPRVALELVDELYDEGASPACHRATHVIGAAALVRSGGNVARTFAEGASTCWSGYYHGILERSLVDVQSRDPRALADVARPLCADVKATEAPWVAYQCLHGLGHGLMITTGLELPRSLSVCNLLDTWSDRDTCKGGVFMENLTPSYGTRSRWLGDDPVYPCNAVARPNKARCYQMVTSRILPLAGDDWEKTAATCAGVEVDFVQVCFESYGRDASSRSGRAPSEIVEICRVARPYGGEARCVESAAMDMTANFTSGEQAAELCASVESELRSRCFFGIGKVMAWFRRGAGERREDCQSIAPSAAEAAACRRGGRSTLPR